MFMTQFEPFIRIIYASVSQDWQITIIMFNRIRRHNSCSDIRIKLFREIRTKKINLQLI